MSGICLLIAPVPVHCFTLTFITSCLAAMFSVQYGSSESASIRDPVETAQRSTTEVCSVSHHRIATTGTVKVLIVLTVKHLFLNRKYQKLLQVNFSHVQSPHHALDNA